MNDKEFCTRLKRRLLLSEGFNIINAVATQSDYIATISLLIISDSKLPHAEAAFSQFGEVQVVPTSQMTHAIVKAANVVLVRSETTVDSSFLNGTNIRFVGTATIGTDHIDLEYLERNNIAWASCPGSNANSVGEYVLAALLETASRLGITLKGKTLGIVGHGNTGRNIERKAKALGMKILLNDPPLARTTKEKEYLALDALMDADIISLHVPLNRSGEDSTFHLFDKARLEAMEGILINSSRGAVVDTQALVGILKARRLRGCVLDVWENEPNLDTTLLDLVTIGTPHIAGYSYDGKLEATRMLRVALEKFIHLSAAQKVSDDTVELREISLPETPMPLEALVHDAVKQCYSIEEDDHTLRRILSLPQAERGAYFRMLRSKYRTRREFHQYIIDASNFDDQTRRAFASLGFRTNDLKDAA